MEEDFKEEQIQEEEVVEKTPKKSKVGRIIFLVLLLILIIIGGVIFWGYQQITKMSDPVDLGVEYTTEDYDALMHNIGLEAESEKLCLDCAPLSFSNPHETNFVVSDSQASAFFDIINENLSYGQVKNSQIRFADGMGEMSTIFTYGEKDYPVYLSGTFDKASEKTVAGEVFDLKVGGINLPSSVKNFVQDGLVNLANERFATMDDTFRIDQVDLTSEGLHFEGLVPTIAE